VLTVAAASVDLHWANTPVAMAIATVKAVLVILFFMHVIHSTRLTWVVIISAILWLGVLFVLTFADYLTRGWAIY
jgi:cytochrome c oxidase subunit 4